MDITNCSKEELAQAVLELTIELGKTRRALNAALEVGKTSKAQVDKVFDKPRYESKTLYPAIDPLATDPRHVV